MRPITDFTSLQDAVNAEVALFVPPGEHVVSAPAVCLGKSLTLRGAGESSILRFTGAGDMLTFVGGPVRRGGDTLRLEALTFTAAGPACGAAVHARWHGPRETPMRSFTARDVTINGQGACGSGGATRNFRTGLRLTNAGNVGISGLHADACLEPGSAAIWLDTDEVCHATEVFIDGGCVLDKWEHGVIFAGAYEGLYFDNNCILSCVTGIASFSSYPGKPGIFVRGNHVNTRMCGVNIENGSQAVVSENLFYSQFGDFLRPYQAVRVGVGTAAYAMDMTIAANTLVRVDDRAPDSFGVVVAGGVAIENVLIADNKVNGYNVGAWLQPGTNGVRFTRTNDVRGARTRCYDEGLNIVET